MSEILEKRIIHLTKLVYSLTIENEKLKFNNMSNFSSLKGMQNQVAHFKCSLSTAIEPIPRQDFCITMDLSRKMNHAIDNIHNLTNTIIIDKIQKSDQIVRLNIGQATLQQQKSSLNDEILLTNLNNSEMKVELRLREVQNNQLKYAYDKSRQNYCTSYCALHFLTYNLKEIRKNCQRFITQSKIVSNTPRLPQISLNSHRKLCTLVTILHLNTSNNMNTIYNKLNNFKFDFFGTPTTLNLKKLPYEYHIIEPIDISHLSTISMGSLSASNYMKTNILKLNLPTVNRPISLELNRVAGCPSEYVCNNIRYKLNFIKIATIQNNSALKCNHAKSESDSIIINSLKAENTAILFNFNECRLKLKELHADARYLQIMLPKNDFIPSNTIYYLHKTIFNVSYDFYSIFTFFTSFSYFKLKFDEQRANVVVTCSKLLNYQYVINSVNIATLNEKELLPRPISVSTVPQLAQTTFIEFNLPAALVLQSIKTHTKIELSNTTLSKDIHWLTASWEIMKIQFKCLKSALYNNEQARATLEDRIHTLTMYTSQIKQRQINWTKNVCRQLLVLGLICKQTYKMSNYGYKTLIVDKSNLDTQKLTCKLVFPSIPVLPLQRRPILFHLDAKLNWQFQVRDIYQFVYALQYLIELYNLKMSKMEIQFLKLCDSNETLQSVSHLMVNSMKNNTVEMERNKDVIHKLEEKEVHLHSRVGELQFQIHKFKLALREKDDQMYRMFNNKLNVRK